MAVNKKVDKSKRVTVRVTEQEDREIRRGAGKLGITPSKYIRGKLFNEGSVSSREIINKSTQLLVCSTDLIEYIRDKYGVEEDEILKELENKIWNIELS